MATLLERNTLEQHDSANTAMYGTFNGAGVFTLDANWTANPDFSQVAGWDKKYWIVPVVGAAYGSLVLLMDPAQRDAVDAAELPGIKMQLIEQICEHEAFKLARDGFLFNASVYGLADIDQRNWTTLVAPTKVITRDAKSWDDLVNAGDVTTFQDAVDAAVQAEYNLASAAAMNTQAAPNAAAAQAAADAYLNT